MCTKRLSGFVSSLFTVASLFVLSACGNSHTDAEIQSKISTDLSANADYSGVTPTVKDGVVTLAGSCKGDHCATDIEDKVKTVEGVQKVENNIAADDKTDLTLRTSVQAVISKYNGVQADVAAGVVVLRGIIERAQLQPLMNELEALKPKKIDNQLAVKQ